VSAFVHDGYFFVHTVHGAIVPFPTNSPQKLRAVRGLDAFNCFDRLLEEVIKFLSLGEQRLNTDHLKPCVLVLTQIYGTTSSFPNFVSLIHSVLIKARRVGAPGHLNLSR
jgi:hypothetical protein